MAGGVAALVGIHAPDSSGLGLFDISILADQLIGEEETYPVVNIADLFGIDHIGHGVEFLEQHHVFIRHNIHISKAMTGTGVVSDIIEQRTGAAVHFQIEVTGPRQFKEELHTAVFADRSLKTGLDTADIVIIDIEQDVDTFGIILQLEFSLGLVAGSLDMCIDNTQSFNIFPAGGIPGGTDINSTGGGFDLIFHNKILYLLSYINTPFL